MQHFDYLSQRRSHILLAIFMAAFLIGLAGAEAIAQSDAPITRIEFVRDVHLGDTTTVRILFEGITDSISYERFDLTVMYDTVDLTFLGGSMGEFVDFCEWESQHLLEQSDGFIQIFAHADLNGTPETPTCFLDTGEVVLAELEFQVTSDSAYDCVTVPLWFYWENCDDNTYWSASTDTIYMSDRVIDDWDGVNIARDDTLPTIHGAPDSCAEITEGKPRARWMDFHNGGVEIICSDSIGWRGDLNLNNVPNEIADFIVYINYFLFGLSAFEIDVDAQIFASDVNADGEVLRVSDIVYLMRIIVGDALPYQKLRAGEWPKAHFLQDDVAKTVTVEYPDTLAGVYLVFSDSIEPVFELQENGFSFSHHYDSVQTNVLMLFNPDNKPGSFDSVLLLSYSGEGILKYAEVGDFRNRDVETVLHSRLPIDFDGIIMLLGYIFSGNYVPEPLESGDVDCDGVVDIDDVVYLIQYIFAGGPEPYIDCP